MTISWIISLVRPQGVFCVSVYWPQPSHGTQFHPANPSITPLLTVPQNVLPSGSLASKFSPFSVPVRLYKGKGCEKCNFTGNKGRIGIFETIYVTEAIQDLILHKASSKDIWETATQQGAVNFFTD